MPQGSVAYALARVHIHARGFLDAPRIERLLACSTQSEALRALAEAGFAGADGGADAEALAAGHVREACALVRKVTPCPMATDSFLLRYDGLNLKALLKARCLGSKPPLLSECGVYPPDLLAHAVADRNYAKLPDTLRPALTALEKILAIREDALAIDTMVDKAVFAQIQANMRRVPSAVIRRYFIARADMLNAVTLLRARRMGRDAAFLRDVLLPGGSIPPEGWTAAYDKPEQLPDMIRRYGRPVHDAAQAVVVDAGSLPALEKAMDDALLKPFSGLKRSTLRLEPVVGYILGAEREAAAVRLILAGQANGFSPEAVRERLRALYGER